MACRRCGRCCREYGLPIPADADLVRFLRYHGADVRHRLDGQYIVFIEAACSHLTDGSCDIYESRPKPCRDYLCPDAQG